MTHPISLHVLAANSDVLDAEFDLVLDGIFGFSFEGSIRAPFGEVIAALKQCRAPIVSIDIPSGWHVEKGALPAASSLGQWRTADAQVVIVACTSSQLLNTAVSLFMRICVCVLGNESGVGLEPQMLVSLTAPKLCAHHFDGPGKIHYLGGRFLPQCVQRCAVCGEMNGARTVGG